MLYCTKSGEEEHIRWPCQAYWRSPTMIRLVLRRPEGLRSGARRETVESLSCGAIPPPSGGRRLARIYEMRID